MGDQNDNEATPEKIAEMIGVSVNEIEANIRGGMPTASMGAALTWRWRVRGYQPAGEMENRELGELAMRQTSQLVTQAIDAAQQAGDNGASIEAQRAAVEYAEHVSNVAEWAVCAVRGMHHAVRVRHE